MHLIIQNLEVKIYFV